MLTLDGTGYPTLANWPLVGRERELDQLGSLLNSSTQGVVLAGTAGVGKTRLAQECCRLAEERGMSTAQVIGTHSASGLPFGAFAPLLPAVLDDPTGISKTPAEMLRQSAASLIGQASENGLLLFVDDVHLLDDASATLVQQVTRDVQTFVVLTLRTGVDVPDPVVALWKNNIVHRIDLSPIDNEAVHELLAAVLGGPVARSAVSTLAARSLGNALYLKELVIGALNSGSLQHRDGLWQLTGPLSPSDRLIELVDLRLRDVSPAEQNLLEIVSIGEPLGLVEVMTLGSADLVTSLERKGLLSSNTEGRRFQVRLSHSIYSEVFRRRIPTLRMREIARQLAEVVEGTGARRREDILRVGVWRLEGGGGSPELLQAAAIRARLRYDLPLAERLVRAALDAGAGFEAGLLAAQLAVYQGRPAQAEAELAVLATEATTDEQRARVAISRLDERVFWLGRVDEGLRMAVEVEATIEDPEWRDEVTARRAGVLLGTKGPEAAVDAAAPLLDRSHGRAFISASIIAEFGLARLGRVEEALRVSHTAYAAHQSLDDPLEWDPCNHLYNAYAALSYAGRIEEAKVLASENHERAIEKREGEGQAFLAWYLGTTVGEVGHVEFAGRSLREAVAQFQQLGRPLLAQFSLVYLVQAHALAGAGDLANRTLLELEDLDLPPSSFLGIDLLQSRAWAAIASGQLSVGLEFLHEAVEVGASIGDRVGEAVALHAIGRLGQPKKVAARLAELATIVEGSLVDARSEHVCALVGGDPERLERVSADFTAMGAHLLAAEAVADASADWRRQKRAREAAAAARVARHLHRRCPGAVTPSLSGVKGRGVLTSAELDVSMLVADGMSNKDVAKVREISVRTVENHLQRAYEKLGITERSMLAEALGQSEAPDMSGE